MPIARAPDRRNLWVLEQAIEDWLGGSAGLKSHNERAFLALVRGAGLPRPRINALVLGNQVDFHWPGPRVVVEVDDTHHDRPPTATDDDRRDEELASADWTTLRFRPAEIELRPERVLSAVRCALARTAHLSSVVPD